MAAAELGQGFEIRRAVMTAAAVVAPDRRSRAQANTLQFEFLRRLVTILPYQVRPVPPPFWERGQKYRTCFLRVGGGFDLNPGHVRRR